MKPENWDDNVVIPLKIIHQALKKTNGEDQYGNLPISNKPGEPHRCPKGPRDATNWAWICHRPNVWQERWKVIPWNGMFAIRYQPVGSWECQWKIVGIYPSLKEAREDIWNFG